MSSQVSRLDVVYRKLLLTKFFTEGWGTTENLKMLLDFRKIISNRDHCYKLVPNNYPITVINKEEYPHYTIIEGSFVSPLSLYMSKVMCEEIKTAYFQMILPLNYKSKEYKPVCIHLAGTGDHFFWRRRNIMAKPLLEKGIGSIILENPYYGLRKPKNQLRSSLRYVSDIFVMGGCIVLECLALLNWCVQLGLGPLGVTGLSMGGHMASLVASNWPTPIVLVPCLSWSTASTVFTEGVMSESIDWDMLQREYLASDIHQNIFSKNCRIVDNPLNTSLFQQETILHSLKDQEDLDNITPQKLLTIIQQNLLKHPHTMEKPDLPKGDNLLSGETRKLNKQKSTQTKMNEIRNRNRESLCFMKGMMDEFTHLKNFSIPFDTSLIISICAKADGYIPRGGTSRLEDIWPGSTVKYVDAGHVSAYIWYRKLFIDSIVEAFEKAKQKLK